MRRLWGEPLSTYRGEFVEFENVRSYPKPVRGAALPVFFGGESGPALRRVAEYGDGWIGFNLTPAEAAAKIRRIEELLQANGRKRSDVELAVSNSGKPISSDDLKRYRDAGVEEFVITGMRAPHTPEEAQSVLDKAAREWLEPASEL
jgi:alkanesulfonate monooxygenase SsuD/methylene tetrahydromethanopterin reductase-like flavin-dependent oxidoreductase (luciferase family)